MKLKEIIENKRRYIETTKNELIDRAKTEIIASEMTILREFEKAINEIDNYCKERKRY